MVTAIRKNPRGVALLTVLLGIALMTLIVVDFATSAGLGFKSAANQANELRAYYLAKSAINVGVALLGQDERIDARSQNPIDTLTDVWAMPYPALQVEGGTVSLTIVDEARKLSINAMVDETNGTPQPKAIQKMERLFGILGVSAEIVPAIVDWIDRDSVESPGGAEGDYYLGLKPPYQPRNGPMPTLNDLRMIRGVNEQVYNRLAPFLTVMPEPQVNANTASPQVLASVEPELTEDQKIVEEIIAARTMQPFSKITDLANLPDLGNVSTRLTQDLTVKSEYFTIAGSGTFAGARKFITGTFHREEAGTGSLEIWNED